MIELTAQGVGTTTKQAEPISKETEKHLWDKGLLGKTTAKSMTNTMFYYNSKLFGLRGVDEHKHLNTDQFDLGVDQRGKYITFNGRASKTYKGKRTCATTLYQAGIPEQEIMYRTGHRSVESVRKYKRAADDMLKDISNVLEPEAIPVKKMRCETVTSPSVTSENETDVISNINIPCGAHSNFSGCVFHFGTQK
ncbi:unnamed protein product [Mytilus edulis]|uniref:ZMYM2-like/QRICH1 C-terminal domain-containing protein n=1 Tax=Mytilus edulis TaxID=6550 RepID=A0A8S3SN49_MYTED|nr:unnamed protein product [Mytilus edulis]